ncbi:MAG: response regulator, partial [Azonexus sp.]
MSVVAGAHVLVVDDDEDILRLLSIRLRARGFRVSTAASAEEALARIAVDPPRAVVSDVRLPGRDGLALFEEIRSTRPTLPVILLTAHGTIPDAVDATSRGVFGYLTKPFDSQVLLEKIDQALQLSAPSGGEESTEPRSAGGQPEEWLAGMVFRSSRMAELMAEARMVAASDASVLIRGESGTGKEVLARAIHLASPRAKGPFIA